LRSMHTGQDSSTPESGVPHTEQVFASSIFLDMVVLRDWRSPNWPALLGWRTMLQFQIETSRCCQHTIGLNWRLKQHLGRIDNDDHYHSEKLPMALPGKNMQRSRRPSVRRLCWMKE
jgi:hypothetical protein